MEKDIIESVESNDDWITVIPWTGGYDSTALVLKALQEGRKIHVPYVEIINNYDCCHAEIVARNRIYMYLNKLGKWNGGHPNTSARIHDFGERSTQCYPYPKWIVYSCLDMPYKVSEVQIGYTASDRGPGFEIDHHCNLIPAITSMVVLTFPGRSIKVTFLFFNVNKVDMLKYYEPLEYRKVFGMIANCAEGYNFDSGCRCNKCLKMDSLKTIFYSKIEG